MNSRFIFDIARVIINFKETKGNLVWVCMFYGFGYEVYRYYELA